MTIDLDGVLLRGQPIKKNVKVVQAMTGLTMNETIDGASTVQIVLNDPFRDILNSGLMSGCTCVVDNAAFELAAFSLRGPSLSLMFEDVGVATLRRDSHPRKAKAYSTSRVGFIKYMVRNAAPGMDVHAYNVGGVSRVELTQGKPPSRPSGQWDPEDVWKASRRIMEDINWRLFMRRGALYAYPDAVLLGGALSIGTTGAAESEGKPVTSMKSLLQQVGFTGQGLRIAMAVAYAESKGNAKAFNDNRSTGDLSYGLFQINMIDNLGPDRRKRYKLNSNEDLFNPVINATVAFKMSKGGEDWSPWSTYKSGAYRSYLGKEYKIRNGGEQGASKGVPAPPTPVMVGNPKPLYTIVPKTNGVGYVDLEYDVGQVSAQAKFEVQTNWRSFFPGQAVRLVDCGPASEVWLVSDVSRKYGYDYATVTLTQPLPALPEPIGDPDTVDPGEKGSPDYKPGLPWTPPLPPGIRAPKDLPATGSEQVKRFLQAAKDQVGRPWSRGDTGRYGWDAGTFIWNAGAAIGLHLPQTVAGLFKHIQDKKTTIPIQQAIDTPGALLFRIAGGTKHAAISVGDGTTFEAMGPAFGCRQGSAYNRGWTHGAVVPGMTYESLGGGKPPKLQSFSEPVIQIPDDTAAPYHDSIDQDTED